MEQSRSFLLAAALGLAAWLFAPACLAVLGQDVSTIDTDRQQLHSAAVQRSTHAAYTVHEMTAPSGTLVREYVSPSGAVFAITWSGPTIPNLQQLMGVHFATMANSPRRQSGGRGHMHLEDGPLVVESTGRARSNFQGRAYLSNALPPGTSADEIQ